MVVGLIWGGGRVLALICCITIPRKFSINLLGRKQHLFSTPYSTDMSKHWDGVTVSRSEIRPQAWPFYQDSFLERVYKVGIRSLHSCLLGYPKLTEVNEISGRISVWLNMPWFKNKELIWSLYILLRCHHEVANSFHYLGCIQSCNTEVKSHHTP